MRGIQLAIEHSRPGSTLYVITDVQAKDYPLQVTCCFTVWKHGRIENVTYPISHCAVESMEWRYYELNLTLRGRGKRLYVRTRDCHVLVSCFIYLSSLENDAHWCWKHLLQARNLSDNYIQINETLNLHFEKYLYLNVRVSAYRLKKPIWFQISFSDVSLKIFLRNMYCAWKPSVNAAKVNNSFVAI